MRGYRHDVGMIAVWDRRGHLTPLSLIWDDGTRYRIDAILEHEGSAVCYRCRIAGTMRRIFYVRERWFVESRRR